MPSLFGFFLSLPGIVAERVGSTRARQFFWFPWASLGLLFVVCWGLVSQAGFSFFWLAQMH